MKSIAITGFLLVLIMTACNNMPTEEKSPTAKAFVSKNTDSFNIAFDTLLTNYDSLRNAFIEWDTTSVNKYAVLLQTALISVPYEQLKDEAEATKANGIAQNTADGLQTLINVQPISDKRRFFYTVSEGIYHLIKTTGYDKSVVYHKKCPMAFNGDKEGWWLSRSKPIDNPYFGKFDPKYKNAMLECGSVEDSINNMQ